MYVCMYVCVYVLVWVSGDRKSGRVGISLHHPGGYWGAHYTPKNYQHWHLTVICVQLLHGHAGQPSQACVHNTITGPPLECAWLDQRPKVSNIADIRIFEWLLCSSAIRSMIGLCSYFDVSSTYGQCFQTDMMSYSIVVYVSLVWLVCALIVVVWPAW